MFLKEYPDGREIAPRMVYRTRMGVRRVDETPGDLRVTW